LHHHFFGAEAPVFRRGEEALRSFLFDISCNGIYPIPMQRTILLKLFPPADNADLLKRTMKAFNEAANYVAREAFHLKTANKMRLQPLVYRPLRERFGLSSQMAIRCIAKVCEAYKRDRTKCPSFKPYGAMVHDERTFSFKGVDHVSLLTLEGRVIVPMVYGTYQATLLTLAKGQADLLYRKNQFFLATTVEVPDGTPFTPEGYLGVDLGIVSLATTSDGTSFTGEAVEWVRTRYDTLRATLQSIGTKSAKRHLKQMSGRERRFKRGTNHVISKRLVATAKDTKRALALENLTGLRARTTVRRTQRSRHHRWAFGELRAFIAYKAQSGGVPVVLVDPRGTSQTCSRCGHCEPANRKSQAEFRCRACGHTISADLNAALNIASRAAANRPIVARSVPATGHVRSLAASL
jgi:putative transposase